MKRSLAATLPFLLVAFAVCVLLRSDVTRSNPPDTIEGSGDFRNSTWPRSFPITPEVPALLHDWSFSFGSYAFGAADVGVEYNTAQQPIRRVTLLRFGTWGLICNARAELLALTGALALAALFAIAVLRRHV